MQTMPELAGESKSVQHLINVRPVSYFSGTVYIATCTCGLYRSGKHATRAGAKGAGDNHAELKQAEAEAKARVEAAK